MHLDLWTSPVVSVSGSKYYLVILDDFTHYLWTFPLNLKSDTFTTLSNFFAYMSNQFGRKVKVIQCDNGREFDNSSTRIFLLSTGTQLWMSCPYTSPQNGKAERIIRSLNNVIYTLLIQASLPGRYWAEGLHTATYLLNHLPTKAIQVACPHIALFRSTPSYEHL
jgi:IS30 family transposase